MIKKFFNKQDNNAKLFAKLNEQEQEQKVKNKIEIKSSLFYSNQNTLWTEGNYSNFASNGYIKNVIAYRCVSMIARQSSFVPIKVYKIKQNGEKVFQKNHQINEILTKPNISQNYTDFMEMVYSSLLISGNAYIAIQKGSFNNIKGLEVLRADRISILKDSRNNIFYRYKDESGNANDYKKDSSTGFSDILHIKMFNPLNDYYGLSPFEVAIYPIDQHNESSKYNKSLLQNCARPSGAIIFNPPENSMSNVLTDEQYQRLQEQINENFLKNTGKPILLEGGLDWKEMSISPRDMDFIECRNMAAREIALAFGIPPQLLGIKGDSTYNNMMEARLALWEQTIIPFINFVTNAFEDFFSQHFKEKVNIDFDMDSVATLSSKRDSEWSKIVSATFMTINEKRQFVGLDPIANGDVFENATLPKTSAN